MEKTFTLGQVLSTGAISLLTGFLISQTAFKKRSKSPDTSVKGKEKKKQSGLLNEASKVNEIGDKDEDEDEVEDEDDDDSSEYDEEDEDEDDDKSYLIDFDTREEYKMVLVIRSDLGMGKGKAAAQCCHATLANYKDLLRTSPMTLRAWEARGQAKVTLKIDSEEEMVQLRAQARSPVSRVNSVTGKLKLY
ncbi:Peptidyl-tRNA hydrolase protein 2, mitochondrial [Lobosporangium transversale]|nr:Peptidyl-tRNA hydrolase protein 2, mitochondrial [Lobosporangium transversale]